MFDDTVAAISTAAGEGGIGIVRMSGKDSLNILSKIFKSKNSCDILEFKSYTLRYGKIIDSENGEEIDEVIVSFMKAPKTYTREDIVEINCHGGSVVTRKVLSAVLRAGAKIAEPGEFTKRAFLNGRIDLSQAEAVIDIIRGKTDEAVKSALDQSNGKLSREVRNLIDNLLSIIASIEALIDFPEDDIEDTVSHNILDNSRNIIKKIDNLIQDALRGKIMREGLNTLIIGKPNVGKSSLMNMLIGDERAIVTDVPGTTRDIIEDYINIRGIPVKIIDTAGIRDTSDFIENIGIEKSKSYIDRADLVICILDGNKEIEEDDEKIMDLIKEKEAIVIVNKVDLPLKIEKEQISEKLNNKPIVFASMKREEGIDKIRDLIVEMFYEGEVTIKDIYVTNIRHKEALIKAKESILNGINTIENGFPLDVASIEFKEAYLGLGEITGDTVSEDIINRIFSEFCIGK